VSRNRVSVFGWRGAACGALAAIFLLAAGAAGAATDRAGNLEAGRKALERQEYVTAVAEFERAVVADPRNPDAYVLLGQAHRRLGMPGRALKYSRLALELRPNHPPALMLRGEAYLDQGQLAPAEEALARLRARCAGQCGPADELGRSIDRFKARNAQR